MRRPRFVLVVRLTLAAMLSAAPPRAGAQDRPAPPDPLPHVETVGMGERRIPPDRASVLLLVESKAPVAAAAASANARAVQAVRDTLPVRGRQLHHHGELQRRAGLRATSTDGP